MQPRFNINDIVSATGPDGSEKTGTIVKAYKLDERWRYVVMAADKTVGVFFDFEMRPLYIAVMQSSGQT